MPITIRTALKLLCLVWFAGSVLNPALGQGPPGPRGGIPPSTAASSVPPQTESTVDHSSPGLDTRANDDDVAVLVAAGEETTLSSQMAGRILRVNAGLGESVAAGATLVEFDCSEQRAQLQAAVAEHRGARETHLTKMKLQALGAAGELEVSVAASVADKAKSQIELRESQLAYCRVAAPFAGRVAKIRVKASESVSLGQPLIEMVNTATLKARMFVPASYIGRLRTGTPFQVRMESGKTFRARIVKLNSRVEGVSQQLEVEGEFEGSPAGLLPGMVGTAASLAGRGAR